MDIKGLIIGLISGICVFFAFQTKTVYPVWVINVWKHPAIIILAILVALLVSKWSIELSAILILCIAAVTLDKISLGSKRVKTVEFDRSDISLPYSEAMEVMEAHDSEASHSKSKAHDSEASYSEASYSEAHDSEAQSRAQVSVMPEFSESFGHEEPGPAPF